MLSCSGHPRFLGEPPDIPGQSRSLLHVGHAVNASGCQLYRINNRQKRALASEGHV